MEPWVVALILKPFGAFLIFGVIGLSIRWAIHKWMPDCWIKRQLLAERFKSAASRSVRQHGG